MPRFEPRSPLGWRSKLVMFAVWTLGCAGRQPEAQQLPAAVSCHAQSPINILTAGVDHDTRHQVALHYQTSGQTSGQSSGPSRGERAGLLGEQRIANLGHTVQVSFAPGSTVEFDGRVYEFRQFHFHTPSEHHVDGLAYAMEMHMVHTLRGDEHRYLVIALLFKHGPASAFLDEFIAAIPRREGSERVEPPGTVDISELLAADERYFHYEGSLTTPPYTEAVTWLVAEQPREASEAQVERFASVEGDNARAVQARNGRVVDEL